MIQPYRIDTSVLVSMETPTLDRQMAQLPDVSRL